MKTPAQPLQKSIAITIVVIIIVIISALVPSKGLTEPKYVQTEQSICSEKKKKVCAADSGLSILVCLVVDVEV